METTGEQDSPPLERAMLERVIQCPSCRAIFRVQEELLYEAYPGGVDRDSVSELPAIENLCLHCSCCDTLFPLRENPYFGSSSEYCKSEAPEDDSYEAETIGGDVGQEETKPEVQSVRGESGEGEAPIGLRPIQENLFALFQSKTVPQQLDHVVQVKPSRSLIEEVPKQESPIEDEDGVENVEYAEDEEFEVATAQDFASDESGREKEQESAQVHEPQEFHFQPVNVEQPEKDRARVIDIVPPDPSALDTVEASQIFYRPKAPRPSAVGSSTTLFFVMGPLLGFLFLLYGFGVYLERDGADQARLRSFLSYAQPSTPPRDLLLHDLKFQRRELANGDEFFVVEGTLVSEHSEAFRRVDIEVLLFNAQGVPVATKVVQIGRPVQIDGSIESVSDLLESEKKLSALENTIEPGKKRPVRIFFPVDAVKKAEFFSARLLSVW